MISVHSPMSDALPLVRDRDLDAYLDYVETLGTGRGLTRRPVPHGVVSGRTRYDQTLSWAAQSGMYVGSEVGRETATILRYGRRIPLHMPTKRVTVTDSDTPRTEIPDSVWHAYRLKAYVHGWRVARPPDAVSPFGEDRWRRFDTEPYFLDDCGNSPCGIRFVGR